MSRRAEFFFIRFFAYILNAIAISQVFSIWEIFQLLCFTLNVRFIFNTYFGHCPWHCINFLSKIINIVGPPSFQNFIYQKWQKRLWLIIVRPVRNDEQSTHNPTFGSSPKSMAPSDWSEKSEIWRAFEYENTDANCKSAYINFWLKICWFKNVHMSNRKLSFGRCLSFSFRY